MKNHPNSAGGKATAIIFKEKARAEYYNNPKICAKCNNIIELRDNEKISITKKKKFCGKLCQINYNKDRKKHKPEKIPAVNIILNMTKSEVFKRYKSYQSARSTICKHARRVFFRSGLPKECKVCQYDTHIDIAHIKSVSSFPDDAKISEINSSENLMALCPNHHWEFDSGLIKI